MTTIDTSHSRPLLGERLADRLTDKPRACPMDETADMLAERLRRQENMEITPNRVERVPGPTRQYGHARKIADVTPRSERTTHT